MKHKFAALAVVVLRIATPACAQPVDLPIPAANSASLPEGVTIGDTPHGKLYANGAGQLLYGMDMRTLLRFGPDPALYCAKECAKQWVPLLAPKDAVVNIKFPQGFGPQLRTLAPGHVRPESAPDWTVIESAAGRQYVYKGWHLVFTRKGAKPGDASFEGADKFIWNTLKYIPPAPATVAPNGIGAVLLDSTYAFADKEGRLLFTGDCGASCASWTPLTGGMASRAIGKWSVAQDGDAPQWRYEGKPVYVGFAAGQSGVPAGGTAIRP